MKKFLSLVLALIMTMSLVTISAGATEYRDLTDKDEIQYEEAVAVLNRIGVITGYEDGSFRPETELTRGAAAKIIVSLLIGPDAAANLPNATAPYPDVPASHTFAGVISYCKTAGIISGYGDGTFKPGNSLTGFAFAKMLLGALGYNSQIEGFVDTGWTMNVAKVGNVTGLFDRLDFDGAGAVNRETACQLALNTLKATMVTYGGTTMVTGAQTLAVQGTQAMYVTSNNREINANINRRVINATNNEMTLEFGEEHFKDLRLEHDKYDPAYDIYGHPSDEWSYKKVTIGTFPLPADFTFTKQMAHLEDSVATKEKALGLRNYDTYSTDHRNFTANWSTASSRSDWNSPFADATQITINGWNARAYNGSYAQTPAPTGIEDGELYTYDADSLNSTGNTVNASLKAQAPSLAEICDLTDNGVTVEVYVCPVDADYITNVVVTRTQLMKVKTVGSDYVRLEDIEPDSRDHYGKANGNNSGLGAITGYNAFAIDGTEWSNKAIADVKDDNYDAYNVLKDMKAGDYVAVVPYTADDGDTWEVGEAYAPETVSGTLTRVDIYNSEKKRAGNAVAITVGGTSYPINEWNLDMIDITDNDIKATRKDVTVYLAKDGTALWTTKVGNTGDWIVVGDYYQGTNDAGKVVWYVHGWTLSGEEIDLDLGTIRGAAEKYAPGELVRYQINTTAGGGEYFLTKPNNNGSSVKKAGMYVSTPADANYPVYPDAKPVNSNYQIAEDPRANGTDVAKNWEGAYRVALAYGDTPTQYAVRKGVDYIALDNYGDPTKRTESAADTNAQTAGYKWDVSTVYYNTNPTFVYVSFDKTGEVETIYFAKGRQDVRNEDLRDYNTSWRNVGTNNDDFVASTAEAYVNDKGRVEAVVIKTDSADADLSGIRIITKNTGSNNYNKTAGADETTSLTGKWNEREYVQGPDFNELKTGVFDKGYNVGDILVGNEKDGIFYAKAFHGDEYRGNSLDGFWVKGIGKVDNEHGKYLEDCFTVATATSTFRTLGGLALTADRGYNEFAPILTRDDETEKDDNLIPYKEDGLIRCVNAKIVDVRVGHEGEITKLKDLLNDFDLSTVELKVLLNGKVGDAAFRNAYVVVILDAQETKNNAEAPTAALSAQTVAAPIVPVAFTGTGSKTNPYVIEAAAGSWVQLTAAPSVKTGTLQTATAKWTVVGNASLNRSGNVIQAQAPATAYDATTKKPVTELVYSIDNYNPTVDGNKTTTGYVYVEIRATGDANPDLGGDATGTVSTAVGTINWAATTVGDKSMVSLTLSNVPAFVPTANGTEISGVLEYALNGGEIPGKLQDLAGTPATIATGNKITFTKSASGWSTETVVSTLPLNNTTMRLMQATKAGDEFVASAVKTKVVDKAGNAVTLADVVTHKTDIAVAGTPIHFELPLTITAGQITVDSITGGTIGDTTNSYAAVTGPHNVQPDGTVSSANGGSAKVAGVKATGKDYVTFTLATALTSLTTKYTITGLGSTNVTVAGSATTLEVAPDVTSSEGSPVVLTATLGDAVPVTADPVEITVGAYKFVFPNDDTTTTATASTGAITANIDLSSATPSVAAKTGVTPTAVSATLTDATAGTIAATSYINITFNETVSLTGNEAVSTGGSATTTSWAISLDSGTVKVLFTGDAPAAGDTIILAAGSVKNSDGFCNKTPVTVTLANATTVNATPISESVSNS